MKRWLSIAAVLCVAAATPLVAQQASSPAPAPQARASAPLAGPRLQPEIRPVEPAFANRSSSASPVVADTHTITVTTLVLVLVVVILVLLIAN
jgi:hypothetical protein